MPKKIPKIHVMRRLLEVDTTVDPDNHDSLDHAAGVLASICAHVAGLDHTTLKVIASGLRRVPAPKPAPEASEPVAAETAPTVDAMDFPSGLDRRAEADSAAAE